MIFRTRSSKPESLKGQILKHLKKSAKEETANQWNLACLRQWHIPITVVTHRVLIKGKMSFKSTKQERNLKNL